MKLQTCLITLVIAALLSTPAWGQKLYRWVDKDGNVHYSDQVPPEENDQAREELNEKGQVVDSIDKAASAEELEAMGEERQRQLEDRQRREHQLAEDRKIELSYVDENAIIEEREQKVAGLTLSIRNAKTFIEDQKSSLASLEERRQEVEAEGGQVSDTLKAMMVDLREQIEQQEQALKSKQQELDEILSFYDSELAKYRGMLARKQERENQS